MANIIVRNAGWVVTMDGRRRIITAGAVKIKGSSIVAVGKDSEIADEAGFKVVDAKGGIVMPGLINAHLHSTQQLARGLADNVFLPTWIHDRIYPYEASLTEEDVYLSSLCCCLESIKTGATCFIDPGGYYMEQAARAVEETGIRAVLARSMVDVHATGRPIPGKMREQTGQALASGEEFVSRYHGTANGRIRAWFSLRTERMVSNDLCRLTRDLAQKYGVGIQSHVANSFDSVNRHKEVFDGLSPLKRFNQSGILGPNLLIFHNNYLTDEEIELCRQYDVKTVHCPTSAFASGSGSTMAKHMEMMEMGITVAVGSDCAAASNFNDMFKVMYTLGAHRDTHRDATLFTPERMLETVILNGARAILWDDEIGSLEEGKKADLIIVDTNGPDWTPVLNPISNLTMSADGHSVRTVIIDGRMVMCDRRVLTVDEDDILARGEKAAHSIVKRAGLEYFAKPRWPVL